MASARARLAVAVIGTSIYAIGGYDGTARARAFEEDGAAGREGG